MVTVRNQEFITRAYSTDLYACMSLFVRDCLCLHTWAYIYVYMFAQ